MRASHARPAQTAGSVPVSQLVLYPVSRKTCRFIRSKAGRLLKALFGCSCSIPGHEWFWTCFQSIQVFHWIQGVRLFQLVSLWPVWLRSKKLIRLPLFHSSRLQTISHKYLAQDYTDYKQSNAVGHIQPNMQWHDIYIYSTASDLKVNGKWPQIFELLTEHRVTW